MTLIELLIFIAHLEFAVGLALPTRRHFGALAGWFVFILSLVLPFYLVWIRKCFFPEAKRSVPAKPFESNNSSAQVRTYVLIVGLIWLMCLVGPHLVRYRFGSDWGCVVASLCLPLWLWFVGFGCHEMWNSLALAKHQKAGFELYGFLGFDSLLLSLLIRIALFAN